MVRHGGRVWLAVVAGVACQPDAGARPDGPRAPFGAVLREAPPGGDGPTEREWGAPGRFPKLNQL